MELTILLKMSTTGHRPVPATEGTQDGARSNEREAGDGAVGSNQTLSHGCLKALKRTNKGNIA